MMDDDCDSDDSDGMLFYVKKEQSHRETHRRVTESGVRGKAEVSAQSAELLHGSMNVQSKRSGSRAKTTPQFKDGDVPQKHNDHARMAADDPKAKAAEEKAAELKAVEEKAAEAKAAEEKAAEVREAEERAECEAEKTKNQKRKQMDAKRKALEKDPHYQKTMWLTGIAKLVPSLDQANKNTVRATKLPAGTPATYQKTFTKGLQAVKDARAEIESVVTKKALKDLLDKHKPMVEKLKTDLAAWNMLYKTYYSGDKQ